MLKWQSCHGSYACRLRRWEKHQGLDTAGWAEWCKNPAQIPIHQNTAFKGWKEDLTLALYEFVCACLKWMPAKQTAFSSVLLLSGFSIQSYKPGQHETAISQMFLLCPFWVSGPGWELLLDMVHCSFVWVAALWACLEERAWNMDLEVICNVSSACHWMQT